MPPKRGRGRGRGGPQREEEAQPSGGRGGRGQQQQYRQDAPQQQYRQDAPQQQYRQHPPQQQQAHQAGPDIYRPPSARSEVGDQPARRGTQQAWRGPARHELPPARHEPPPPARHEPPPARHEPPPVRHEPPPSASRQRPSVSVDDATKSMSEVQLVPRASKYNMAARPGYGRNGRPIGLIANYLLLQYRNVSIYHYDVNMEFIQSRRKEESATGGKASLPKKGSSLMTEGRTAKEDILKKVSHIEHQLKRAPGKQRCREIFSNMLKSEKLEQYYPVYDGQKNMYTIQKLPIKDKKTYRVTLDEEDRYKDFDIVIKPVEKQDGSNIIDVSKMLDLFQGRTKDVPQEVIMVFDTIMNHRNPPLQQCQVGRSFFLLNQRPYSLGDGLEIWFGYNQSVHLTERGPAVIVNFSAKAFHRSGSVIEYANEIFQDPRGGPVDIVKFSGLDRRQVRILAEKLKKVKIQVTHLPYPRKYTVKGVTNEAARDLRLSVDGKDKTVAKYFQEKYSPLKYPHLPCLHMQSTNKTTYLPLEVCTIMPNQPVLGKLDGQGTSNMIRKTAIPPEDRFSKIRNQMQDIQKYSGDAMRKFNLFMEMEFMKLNGRVIPAPSLAYRNTGRDPPVIAPDQKGTWRMDGKQFFRSTEDCSWALISFANTRFCGEECLQRFADTLCRIARSAGMNLQAPRRIQTHGRNVRTWDALRQVKDLGVNFAVVVLSSRDEMHTYEEVKFLADIKLGLITQCMDEQVVAKKFNPQVAGNVLLKVNSKIGGINHAVAQKHKVFSRPVIIFGADAAHSPRGYRCPSIAAVVGSLDAHPSQYAVTCRTQRNRDEQKLSQEVIIELKDMVKQILNKFMYNTRGKKPESVIFFRDGVSEGQFSTVLENEVPEIQRACLEELGCVPPLTFIVVQKRHQTRFRPQNPRDGVGRMGNVPPGTTVDTDVVHPVFFDFFICSHEGIQGTSKPAHYTVLFDDNGFNADELQQLCYHLCHMYARCNRSISIPAPVMYAHLACARAKKYADLHIRQMDTQSVASSGSSGEDQSLPPDVQRAINEMGSSVGTNVTEVPTWNPSIGFLPPCSV